MAQSQNTKSSRPPIVPEKRHSGASPTSSKDSPVSDKMLRVLIVDDHPMMRCGLGQTLTCEFPHVVLGEAGDANEALGRIWKEEWDLVLLDISMPGRNGLEALKEIKQFKAKLPVLVLSAHSEDQFAIRVLQKGASGYLTKDIANTELVSAVRHILAGGKYIRPSIAEKLASQLNRDVNRASHELLSDREYQVMCMLASGQTVKEIAAELSLSVKTISTHRSRILGKMTIKNNAGLMRYAVEHELVDLAQNVGPESHAKEVGNS